MMKKDEAPILDRWVVAQRLIPCLGGLSSGHPLLFGSGRLIGTSDLWLMSPDQTWQELCRDGTAWAAPPTMPAIIPEGRRHG